MASFTQLESLLLSAPSYVVIAVMAIAAGFLLSARMAALVVGTLGFCVLNRQWDTTMQTLALAAVALLLDRLTRAALQGHGRAG